MKTTRLILSAAALTLMAGTAAAQAAVLIDQRAPLTRADVKAEVQAARQDGSLNRYDADSYVPDPSTQPVTSTVDDEPEAPLAVLVVTDPTLQPAPLDGKPVVFATTVTTASYYPVAVETSQPMSRAEVRAAFQAARQAGENSPFNPDPYVNSPSPLTQE